MGVLEAAKFVLDLVKGGAALNVDAQVINVLPEGASRNDFSGWQGPVLFDEIYQELSAWFGSDLADFTLTVQWEYNGQYIANFRALVNGSVQVLNSIDIRLVTLGSRFSDAGVAELPYQLEVTFYNVVGTRRTIIKGVACGDEQEDAEISYGPNGSAPSLRA